MRRRRRSSRRRTAGAASREARRRRESSEFALEQRGEPDRCPILEVRADRLEPDREPGAGEPDRERRRRLAGERGDAGIDEPEVVEDRAAPDLERIVERLRVGRVWLRRVGERWRVEVGRQQDVPFAKEGAPRRARLLALAEVAHVLGGPRLEPAERRAAELVLARLPHLDTPAPLLLGHARGRHRGEERAVEGVVAPVVAEALGLPALERDARTPTLRRQPLERRDDLV